MTKEQRRILYTVCLGTLLFFNSLGSINVALPTMQREFGASLGTIQWVSIIGVVMISSLSLCFGRAGDILGRRKLYRIGIVLYTLGSGLSGLSQSIVQLLILRSVMALGLAMAAPLSAAILASNFPKRRGWALGWYASASAIGRATGPTFGGMLLYFFSWRAIFFMNLLVGLLISVAVHLFLKGEEERYPEAFDLIGTVALLIAYPSLLIALSLGANTQWTSPQIPLWFLTAAVGTVSFVWIELRARNPLINPSLFRSLPFSAVIISLVMFSAMYSPLGIFGPLYLENVLDFSPVVVGLIMTALPVFTALSSPFSGRLSDQFDSRYVAMLGLAFLGAGIWVYAHLGTTDHYLWIVASFALIGTGTGFFTPANQRTAFATIGQEHYGIVSAMLSSFNTASGTLGITVAVALIAGKGMIGGKGFDNPAVFASAQQFAFMAMLPLAGVAILVLFLGDSKKVRKILTP